MGNEQKNRSLEERIAVLERSEKLLGDIFNESSAKVGFMEARFQEIEDKLKEIVEDESIGVLEERVEIVEGKIQVQEYGT